MHPIDTAMWILAILAILIFIWNLERKFPAKLIEKTVRYENRSGQPVTKFFCKFSLGNGRSIVREVDTVFFNQVSVGRTGVVYRKRWQVTELRFKARS